MPGQKLCHRLVRFDRLRQLRVIPERVRQAIENYELSIVSRTQKGPMIELINRGESLENAGDTLVVSVCAGFALANIRDVGPSVTVRRRTGRFFSPGNPPPGSARRPTLRM